jgi:hypothetical protein
LKRASGWQWNPLLTLKQIRKSQGLINIED